MLNLKDVAGMDMYHRKQNRVNTIQMLFFVTLNYCAVHSFKIVWFGAQCYFHWLVISSTKV